jgi:hypothetical protein
MIEANVNAAARQAAQPVLSQTSEPAQELPETLEECLLGALRRHRGMIDEWQVGRERGVTNEQLKAIISREWGLGGGTSGPGHVREYHKGGANPRFWFNSYGPYGVPTLQGAALLTKARELLQLPFPQPATEPAPVLNGEQEPEPTPTPIADDAPELTPADEIARAMSNLHFETRKYIRRNLIIKSNEHEQSADKIAVTPTMSSLMPRDDGKFSDYEMHQEAAAFYRLLADLLPI